MRSPMAAVHQLGILVRYIQMEDGHLRGAEAEKLRSHLPWKHREGHQERKAAGTKGAGSPQLTCCSTVVLYTMTDSNGSQLEHAVDDIKRALDAPSAAHASNEAERMLPSANSPSSRPSAGVVGKDAISRNRFDASVRTLPMLLEVSYLPAFCPPILVRSRFCVSLRSCLTLPPLFLAPFLHVVLLFFPFELKYGSFR